MWQIFDRVVKVVRRTAASWRHDRRSTDDQFYEIAHPRNIMIQERGVSRSSLVTMRDALDSQTQRLPRDRSRIFTRLDDVLANDSIVSNRNSCQEDPRSFVTDFEKSTTLLRPSFPRIRRVPSALPTNFEKKKKNEQSRIRK